MGLRTVGTEYVFGEWDAPCTDEATRIEAPTGLNDPMCMHCTLPFINGDNGMIMLTGLATHKECQLRSVLGGIGHIVDHERYCHGPLGPDAGLPFRQSARLVWTHHMIAPVTRKELESIIDDAMERM